MPSFWQLEVIRINLRIGQKMDMRSTLSEQCSLKSETLSVKKMTIRD